MQKTARDYLNCRYELLKNNKDDAKNYKNNNEQYILKEIDNFSSSFSLLLPISSMVSNYFKTPSLYWYGIIVPALLLTFVRFFNFLRRFCAFNKIKSFFK